MILERPTLCLLWSDMIRVFVIIIYGLFPALIQVLVSVVLGFAVVTLASCPRDRSRTVRETVIKVRSLETILQWIIR